MRAFHILIVDDDSFIRKTLEALLRRLSFNNIDQAANGFEALKLLVTRQYDLIFLDNLMPAMTGMEFLRRCRNSTILDWTTVFMVTTTADRETLRAIRDEGLKVDEFVIKPIDFALMSSKIDRLLRSDRANPTQRLLQIARLPADVQKGLFLSINIEKHGPGATLRLFGFLLYDDRNFVKDLPDSVAIMPEKLITLDLSNLLTIDEFGLGMVLLINGIATMAGKQFSMVLDEKTIGKRLVQLGLPRIVPVVAPPKASPPPAAASPCSPLPGHFDQPALPPRPKPPRDKC